MSIKYLFDDLKKIGKKKYISYNDIEELYYTNNKLQIEIVKYGLDIDLLISIQGQRQHYLDSPLLSHNEKRNIQSILSSMASETMKAATISPILLDAVKNQQYCE